MPARHYILIAGALSSGCLHQASDEDDLQTATHAEELVTSSASTAAPDAPTTRGQSDGRAFPDGVLALTWDDGPDAHTLALAEYLARERVSATFFVVGEWTAGVSSDPGIGAHVYESGHRRNKVLADLVSLGHRIGNHTLHHVLLGHADAQSIDAELGDNQAAIDPFIRDEMRIFRVPGGDWNAAASRVVDADERLAPLVGPIRWDVDAKDWDGSVSCRSRSASRECERTPNAGLYRVRPEVMAQRYETTIESTRHGIVLLHDRVGDVGSEYALDVARALVPRLIARGYVFAAPVLAFSPMRTRWSVATCAGLRLGDIDGDGRADSCVRDHDRVTCARSTWHADEEGLEHVSLDPTYDELLLPTGASAFDLADVNGDSRADVCVKVNGTLECAIALQTGWRPFERWSHDAWGEGPLHFADLDGDGKADVCQQTAAGVACARSAGTSLEPAHLWLATPQNQIARAISFGDVNGDGHVDLCVETATGIDCALGTRGAFGHLAHWSSESPSEAFTLGDLNGDGRADLCAPTAKDGVACALSNGRSFTKATTWVPATIALDSGTQLRAEWGRVGDINGDGRSDICDCDGNGVRCALAP